MTVIILFAIIGILVGESTSYPHPGDLPYPLPSEYGSGPGFELNVETYPSSQYLPPLVNIGEAEDSGINHYGSQIHGEISDASNQILTPLANLGDSVNSKIVQAVNSKQLQVTAPFPNSGRQHAVLEYSAKETIPIQADIKYGNLQQFAANFFDPKPIVDTIQEHEKYGNDGSKGKAVSTLVVSAFEGLSNALNAAVDAPFQVAKAIGRKITDTLNPVGAKLVGLA